MARNVGKPRPEEEGDGFVMLERHSNQFQAEYRLTSYWNEKENNLGPLNALGGLKNGNAAEGLVQLLRELDYIRLHLQSVEKCQKDGVCRCTRLVVKNFVERDISDIRNKLDWLASNRQLFGFTLSWVLHMAKSHIEDLAKSHTLTSASESGAGYLVQSMTTFLNFFGLDSRTADSVKLRTLKAKEVVAAILGSREIRFHACFCQSPFNVIKALAYVDYIQLSVHAAFLLVSTKYMHRDHHEFARMEEDCYMLVLPGDGDIIYKCSPCHLEVVDGLFKGNEGIEDSLGLTPVQLTALLGQRESFTLYKGPTNIEDSKGNTLLHLAVVIRSEEIIYKASPKLDDLDVQNSNGHSPLHIALSLGLNIDKYFVRNRQWSLDHTLSGNAH